MSKRIREHLRSNVVGYVAIFLFAIGGTAYATHPGGANTISSGDIINGEVQTLDIATSAVTAGRLASNSVNGAKVTPDSLSGADVANNDSLGSAEVGGLTGGDITDGSLTGDDVADTDSLGPAEVGELGDAELGPNSVSFDEIAPGTFFSGDIANQGFGDYEIANNAVQTNEISDGAVGAPDLAPIVTRTSSVTVPNAGSAFVTASCEADELLISGGSDWVHSGPDIYTAKSRVQFPGLGGSWGVRGGQFTGSDQTLSAEAYCLDTGIGGFGPKKQR